MRAPHKTLYISHYKCASLLRQKCMLISARVSGKVLCGSKPGQCIFQCVASAAHFFVWEENKMAVFKRMFCCMLVAMLLFCSVGCDLETVKDGLSEEVTSSVAETTTEATAKATTKVTTKAPTTAQKAGTMVWIPQSGNPYQLCNR